MLALLVTRATVTQNSPFPPLAMAIVIASTHCTYIWRDGQAPLIWVLILHCDIFSHTDSWNPHTVTHPNTNRVRRRVTLLIKISTLPQNQTATSNWLSSVQQHLAKTAPNNCTYLRPQTRKYDTKTSIKPVRIRCGAVVLAFAFFDQVWAGHDPDLLTPFCPKLQNHK